MRPSSSNASSEHPPPMLVGRKREQALLRQALDDMLAGHGSLVLVSGEAGIGKTTLVEWLAVEAETRGCLVLWGHAYDLSVTPPYGPWLEIFREYRASGDAALPPVPAFVGDAEELAKVGSQETLFTAVAEFFFVVSAHCPLVLVLDDVHWADQASLDFLRFLARRLADHRLLLVATYRSDELHRRHPLNILLPLLVREARPRRVLPQPLDHAATKALLASRYRLVPADQERLLAWIQDHAEGNPFFIEELLHTLEGENLLQSNAESRLLRDLAEVGIPPLLRQIIDRRLERLGVEAVELLSVAAVIGQQVPLDIWRQVSGVDDDHLATAMEQAIDTQLISELASGDGWRFRHALVRDALYQRSVSPRRRSWHRRVAEVLESLPQINPDSIAYHYEQAGDSRAIDWLIRAGERAEQSYAWRIAATRFDTAAELMEGDARRTQARGWLLYRSARRLIYAAPDESIARQLEARALAEQIDDPLLSAVSRFEYGILQCFVGEVQSGIDHMTEALATSDLIHHDNATQMRAAIADFGVHRGKLILWLGLAGRLRECINLGERVVSEIVQEDVCNTVSASLASHQDQLAATYAGMGQAQIDLGRPDLASRLLEEARRLFRSIGDHQMESTVAYTWPLRLMLSYYADLVEERVVAARSGEEAWLRSRGLFASDTAIPLQLLPILYIEGRWAEALAVKPWVTGWHGNVGRQNNLRMILGKISHHRGDSERAWEYVRHTTPGGPSAAPGNSFYQNDIQAQFLAAALALDAHDLPTARAWLEAHDRWLEWSGAVLGQAEGALLWGQYHSANGDHTLARQRAEQALIYASDPRQPLVLIAAHRFLGQLDTEARLFERAEDHLQASLTVADACAAPFERALTLLQMAELRTAQAKPSEATALLDEVQTICEPLGAKPTLARVNMLRQRLENVAHAPPRYPAGLTAREIEVLRLVAEGLTDAEVAGQLFLSPRTIGSHLRSIYNKIGVGSRAAASRFAAEHHLI
jgi:DNA-binding CsgD family transcriptional regulator